jgi:hypothetical protein
VNLTFGTFSQKRTDRFEVLDEDEDVDLVLSVRDRHDGRLAKGYSEFGDIGLERVERSA